jgi:dihydrofolate reductase
MRITIVVAIADNGIIGRDGGLPWRISSDLKTFRRLTMGKPLIMGRRTFQSLGKPLDGRDNIVISGDPDYRPDGALMAADFDSALSLARACAEKRGVNEIAVVGGTAVFAAALPIADRIYKTEVHGAPSGDAVFPEVDWNQWREVAREDLPHGPNDDARATLVVLDRR